MLTETFFRIPFSVIGRCSLMQVFSNADLTLAAGKMTCERSNLPQAASNIDDFTESQAASCRHAQSLSRHFRAFERGYWQDFQN
jgi:hypothetical protein